MKDSAKKQQKKIKPLKSEEKYTSLKKNRRITVFKKQAVVQPMRPTRQNTGTKVETKRSDIRFVLPVVSLFIVLLVLTVYDAAIKQRIADSSILPPIPAESSDYPLLTQRYEPGITAESAVIYDETANVMLYEKKPLLRFSMASTAKIMTALVALEHFRKNDILTVSSIFEEGVIIGFMPGDKVRFEDMLYALLLPSANDVAFSIAENYPGGIEGFVRRMNEKAGELQLRYTHYADPAGLDDDGNYTVALDLARLTSYALGNKEFAVIIATKEKVISTVDGSKTYTVNNLNKLLGENGVIGVKTGFTEGAGEVLVTAKNERGHLFIIIVMKSRDRFADTEILLRYISDNVYYVNPGDYLLNSLQ